MAKTRMRILTEAGIVDVNIRSASVRSTVGSYWNAVQQFLGTGDEAGLRTFADVKVAGRALLTDPARIEALARRGETDIDEIYED